jgi:hypothetical protein
MAQMITPPLHVSWHNIRWVLAPDELKEVGHCSTISTARLLRNRLIDEGRGGAWVKPLGSNGLPLHYIQ